MERYRVLKRYISGHWPRLAVLRLHLAMLWLLAASALARMLARAWAGDPTAPRDTTGYMMIWAVLGTLFAAWWFSVQWSERPSLPRPLSPGVAWSPGASLVMISLAFLPVYVAGNAADQALYELGVQVRIGEAAKSILPPDVRSGRQTIREVRATPLRPQASASVRTTPVNVDERETVILCQQLANEMALSIAQGPRYLRPGHNQPASARLPLVKQVVSADLLEAARSGKTCAEETDPLRIVADAALVNLQVLARVHGLLGGQFPRGRDFNYVAVIALLVLFISALSSLAGLVSREIVVRVALLLLTAVVVARLIAPLIYPSFGITPRGAAELWRLFAQTGWLLGCITWFFWTFQLRERSSWKDATLAVVLLLPVFIPIVEWGFLETRFRFDPLSQPEEQALFVPAEHLYIHATVAGYLLLGCLFAPILSRYRALPRAV